jgi:hypothetical protein
MCDVCRYFEGWTVGDALGLRLPLCELIYLNREGYFELIGNKPRKLLYGLGDFPMSGISNLRVQAPMQEGVPTAEYYDKEGYGGHLLAFDNRHGLIVAAVPLSWKYGILVDDAREWLVEGKIVRV